MILKNGQCANIWFYFIYFLLVDCDKFSTYIYVEDDFPESDIDEGKYLKDIMKVVQRQVFNSLMKEGPTI